MADNFAKIELVDNSGKTLEELHAAVMRALERCGLQAEGYAKDLAPVDVGALRNSITHKVDEAEQVAYIGSNLEYAAYQELGTGKFYPGGRQEPWAYQDSKGQWHMTHGQRAQPFIKPAVAGHGGTYKNIIESELKGGQ